MKIQKRGRYDTTQLVEDQAEPGSHGRVLRNLRGIFRKRDMNLIETREYYRALDELVDVYDKQHRFTAADIRKMHRAWLGGIYPWAGKYRQVNISKAGFHFAAAKYLTTLMDEFERGPLRRYTPCIFSTLDEIIRALAVVHVELVLIHPFREGNGRLARLVATFMSLQAGLPPLDFTGIRGTKRTEYFGAVRAGMDRNYEPMEKIFSAVIRRTLRIHGKR